MNKGDVSCEVAVHVSEYDRVCGVLKHCPDVTVRAVCNDTPHPAISGNILLADGVPRAARARVIASMPGLKWIHTSYASISWLACNDDLCNRVSRGIVVTNGRGIDAAAISEWAIAVMLWHAKRLHKVLAHQGAQVWQSTPTECVGGATLAVLGLGAIGTQIIRRLNMWDITIRGVSRSGAPVPGVSRVFKSEDRVEALDGADYAVLALPATGETRGIVGRRELQAMRPGAFVVNVGRGSCLDEQALIDLIERKHLSGAGLDVFQEEPLPSKSRLWSMPGVLVSPHNAWYSGGRRRIADALLRENVHRFQRGEKLRNIVDISRGY